MSLKVELYDRQFDLDPVAEAVQWAYDQAQRVDEANAAKNCSEDVRWSPVTSLLEQAYALLGEMRQWQWHGEHKGEMRPVIVLTDPVYFDDPASHCD